MNSKKVPALVGAAIGLAAFVALALLPALTYGGYAGVVLAGGIFGLPVDPSVGVRALIVLGMILGVAAIGALFALAGAAAGSVVGALVAPVLSRKGGQEEI